ncbi:small RNA 2'-O-methyltransferase [Schistocerca nitens]|uniref:small RNA 2'-O-methyltransferase n=1 Tax=Schistocerca nitens TaxID=7011 RepID=UPI00211947B2|nr:small RNA 2'-O-methyltransferase [Schistocerca nitens]
MIITFHVALLELWNSVKKCLDIGKQEIADELIYPGVSRYSVHGVEFYPPVNVQRQEAVHQIISDFSSRASVKKIVDFGCGCFQYFKLFKNIIGIEEILEIDVNEEMLYHEHSRIAPTASDFLTRRKVDCKVQVLQGSISDLDCRLLGTDIFVCIEVIEHLFPETLESVPYTVFGFMKPQIAIFSTPNRDINILFDMRTPFRDEDHKFEWSRMQFKCWGNNIVQRYPEYEVSYYGIGKGPEGAESLGCCSQLALFSKKLKTTYSGFERPEGQLIYKLIAEYNYLANSHDEEGKSVLDEVWEIIQHMNLSNDYYDADLCVPLSLLHSKLKLNTLTISELREVLENGMWKVRDCSGETYVFPYAENNNDSDDFEDDQHADESGPSVVIEQTEGYEGSWEQCVPEDEQWSVEDEASVNEIY